MNGMFPTAASPFHGRALGKYKPFALIGKALAGLALLGSITTAAAAVQPLSVSGNKILAGGQPASFAGNSLFWSNNGWGGEKYYSPGTVAWLKSDWKSSIVRAAMGVQDGGGYLEDPAGNKAKVKTVVDAAIANDMYAIIDWHSHKAQDNQAEAIAFFQEMARTYGQTNNVIYEIYNEPMNVGWGTIKPYAQAVINAIRAIDPDNLIIVGTPNWSQDVDVATADPVQGNNIAYTLHFYAGTHGQFLRDKAQTALNRNYALFVTEWGSVNADGNGAVNAGETQAWVDFMKARGISNANWSINDKPEGASALTSGASGNGGWSAGQLTASGANAKSIISSWPSAQPPVCIAAQLPATIEAEAFCSMSGVQTEATSDTGGGSNVGYLDAGDFMSYDVNVPTTGSYLVSYRVASLSGGGAFQLGSAGAVNVPSTGDWQTWTTVTQTLQLSAGKQSLKLAVINGGFNINWLKIQPESASSSSATSSSTSSVGSSVASGGLVKPLSVQGNKIYAGGAPASFAGNSFYWSLWGGEAYYNANVVSWLKKDWHSQIVRAAMGVGPEDGGYIQNPNGQRGYVKAVVDAAIANDMYVIIDWHTHHAEDYKAQAIAFFQDMARTYGDKPNVIYEIYNEPLNTTDWHNTIKPYAQDVVNAIRAIDPDNLIVVGTQTWSQDVDKAAADRIAGTNIAYTLHFYVGTHGQSLRDKAQGAINSGIALFVTEWGFWGANNTCCDFGEADAWQNFMKSNGLSNAGWSLIGFDEPSSHLLSGASTQGGWTSLRPAGNYVKNMILNWPGNNVTKECKAFAVGSPIEAEDYVDMSGIQTEATTDVGGGSNVGYIDANDSLTYCSINVPAAGYYTVSYRVASLNGGGILQLSNEAGASLGSVNIAATGGWQNWTTVSHQVYLNAGQQKLKLTALAGGFNLNWLRIDPVVSSSSSSAGTSSSVATSSSRSSSSSTSSSSSVTTSSSSSSSTAYSVTLQAEDWEVMNGVQTEATSDTGGGLNVGWLDAGDWISYGGAKSVNIPVSGTYSVEFRVASPNSSGLFNFEKNGGTVNYGSVVVPNTGGYQNWVTIKTTVSLTAGTQGFGIAIKSGSFNINWFRITKL